MRTINDNNILSLATRKKEHENALKALEKAKQIPRKVIFLPKGASGSNKFKKYASELSF